MNSEFVSSNERKIWTPDNFDYSTANVGDYVDAEVVMNAMNCVPSACMWLSCAQMGEPYSHREDPRTGRLRPVFATFRCVEGDFNRGVWQYCGHCFHGEVIERGNDPAYV